MLRCAAWVLCPASAYLLAEVGAPLVVAAISSQQVHLEKTTTSEAPRSEPVHTSHVDAVEQQVRLEHKRCANCVAGFRCESVAWALRGWRYDVAFTTHADMGCSGGPAGLGSSWDTHLHILLRRPTQHALAADDGLPTKRTVAEMRSCIPSPAPPVKTRVRSDAAFRSSLEPAAAGAPPYPEASKCAPTHAHSALPLASRQCPHSAPTQK